MCDVFDFDSNIIDSWYCNQVVNGMYSGELFKIEMCMLKGKNYVFNFSWNDVKEYLY